MPESDKSFTADDARRLGKEIGIDWTSSPFDVEQFRTGMNVELEHGLRDPLTNVTDDDPHTTAKIALAHLNEFPDYYTRLELMEEAAKRDWANEQTPDETSAHDRPVASVRPGPRRRPLLRSNRRRVQRRPR